jgi:hypothetical protein
MARCRNIAAALRGWSPGTGIWGWGARRHQREVGAVMRSWAARAKLVIAHEAMHSRMSAAA